jgi:integrase
MLIKRRKDGRIEIKVGYTDALGETKRTSVYGKNVATAKTKAEKKLADLNAGVDISAKPQTLAQYMLPWSQRPQSRNIELKQSTKDARRLTLQRVIASGIGGYQLDKITAEHIRTVDNLLDKKGLSGASRKQSFAILKTALGDAVRDKLIATSPFNSIDWIPAIAHKEMRFLTALEQAKLSSRNDEWTPVWQFLLATGLRAGEAFALSWKQVDLDARRISITQSIRAKKGGWTLSAPKTKQSRRTLQIAPEVVEVLRGVQARQEAEARRLGEVWDNPHEFVFHRVTGQPVLPYHALSALQSSLSKAEVEHCRVHDLRHTFASNHINGGTPILAVSRMLGHSSVAFTLQVYGHLTTETLDAAASLSGRLLSEALRMNEALEVAV